MAHIVKRTFNCKEDGKAYFPGDEYTGDEVKKYKAHFMKEDETIGVDEKSKEEFIKSKAKKK